MPSVSVKTVDGLTLYAVFRRVSDLTYWNTFTFALEAFNAAHWYGSVAPNYSIAATKTVQSANVTAEYAFAIPSSLPSGVYFVEWYSQAGANPAVTDGQPPWATEDVEWNGSAILPSINSGGNAVADMGNVGFPGGVAINQDTGGTDAMTIRSGGNPVVGATIRVFRKSDYTANPTTATPLGGTTSDVNGHWLEPIFVSAGNTYAVVVSAIGEQTQEVDVTV